MIIKYYKIRVIEPTTVNHLTQQSCKTSWLIAAGSLESAWRKFCHQHFGALSANPADYDVAYDHCKTMVPDRSRSPRPV